MTSMQVHSTYGWCIIHTKNDRYKYTIGQRENTDHLIINKVDLITNDKSNNTIEYGFKDVQEKLQNNKKLKYLTDYQAEKKAYIDYLIYHYKMSHPQNKYGSNSAYITLRKFIEPLMKSECVRDYNDNSSSLENMTMNNDSYWENKNSQPNCFVEYDKNTGIGIAKTTHGNRKVMWSVPESHGVKKSAINLCPNIQQYVPNINILLQNIHKNRFYFNKNETIQRFSNVVNLTEYEWDFNMSTQIPDFNEYEMKQNLQGTRNTVLESSLPNLEYIIMLFKLDLSYDFDHDVCTEYLRNKLNILNKITNFI